MKCCAFGCHKQAAWKVPAHDRFSKPKFYCDRDYQLRTGRGESAGIHLELPAK